MTDENPYQSPGATGPPEPLREDRLLGAAFEVDRRLVGRAVGFLLEKRLRLVWIEHALVGLLLLGLLIESVFRLPRAGWAALVVLVLLQPLVLGWQWYHVRRQLRSWQHNHWPRQFGTYRVQVSQEQMTTEVEGEPPTVRTWPLSTIAHVYYLGDLLLIVPEPQVLIPIPRTGEFAGDTFAGFCATLARRYRAAHGLAE